MQRHPGLLVLLGDFNKDALRVAAPGILGEA